MPDVPELRYRRILIKLSGEALMGDAAYGIDPATIKRLANEIRELGRNGAEIALVLGAGNFFRGSGLAAAGIDRVTADHMGMLATIMNSLALQDALEQLGSYARVMSAIKINEVCEDYIRRRAVRHLEKGARGNFCRRHRQSFFYHGFSRQPEGCRDQCRPADQGDQGGRGLFRGPGARQIGNTP